MQGEAPAQGYDNHCRDLSEDQIKAYEAEGRSSVPRFRMPDGSITFNDHCTSDGEGGVDDFVYPATDVYIVDAGADEDGAELKDVGGGSANTIVGTGSGAFLGELIAAVYPSGKLGDGE